MNEENGLEKMTSSRSLSGVASQTPQTQPQKSAHSMPNDQTNFTVAKIDDKSKSKSGFNPNPEKKKKILHVILIAVIALSILANVALGYLLFTKNKAYADQKKTIDSKIEEIKVEQDANKVLADELAAANAAIAAAAAADAQAAAAAPTTTAKKSSGTSSQESVVAPPAPPSD